MRLIRLAHAASLAAVLVATPLASSAHHSFAMYDQTRPLVLRGAVTSIQWTNPHVMVFFQGAPAGGGPARPWVLELTSPGNLKRIGWTRTSVPTGQPIEVEISPLRDGQNGGALKRVTVVATGQTLTANWLRPGG